MGREIEHKFLVKNSSYRHMAEGGIRISQGYLCREPDRTVRVRIMGEKGYLTVKGRSQGASRAEFEYEIPCEEAVELLGMCVPPVLEKIRYFVHFKGKTWEVDEFAGRREGLVTAEIELQSECEIYEKPEFVGEDITGIEAYYNSNL